MQLAHFKKESGREQPLIDHLRAVAALCGKAAAKFGLYNMGYLTGLLHDGGKARTLFQNYLKNDDSSLKGKINHSAFGAQLLQEVAGSCSSKFAPVTAQLISVAVFSHHTGLLDCLTPQGENGYAQRFKPEEEIDYAECRKNFIAECVRIEELSELFQKAVEEFEVYFSKIVQFNQFGLGLTARLLFSCLIDADRYDTYCFDANILPTAYEIPVWSDFEKKVVAYLDKLRRDNAIGGTKEIKKIKVLRQEISDVCRQFAENPGGIYQLFVPTGGGKTLASLRYALAHCAKFKLEHIYYIIPFCSILEQNSKEVKNALQNSGVVLEHHSNVTFDGPDTSSEDFQRYELVTQRWNVPVVLTTMVQFLDTLFSGRTQAGRRLHELANSVLIFDEIQALPVKCIHLFNAAVNFLSEVCHATVILCTATQPQLSKTEPVPLRLTEPVNIVPDIAEKFRQFKRTQIINRISEKMSFSQLAELAKQEMQKKDSVLIVLNTKKAVQSVYTMLCGLTEKESVFLLSTNLCPENRGDIIETLQKRLRPGSGQKTICVSSQLIEAGVDLSFGCAIRSLAGLDNIAQTAGRCNRHGEYAQTREVYVVSLPEENLSSLPEIQTAQRATIQTLSALGEGLDLLSPEAVELYYLHYFHERSHEMGYRLKAYNETMYHMLDQNRKAIGNYRDLEHRNPPLQFFQSFHTTGENFRVIDSPSYGVIVPYKKGKEYIEELCGECSTERLRILLRSCQRFTVNVYRPELERLYRLGAVQYLQEKNVFILRDGNYSEETGITDDGTMEFLQF